MQKIIKRISLILAVALSVVCIGVLASACTENKEATEFVVTVYYSDGTTKVNGNEYTVAVGFCVDDGACYGENPLVDANGEAKMSISTLEAWRKSDKYNVHAFNSDGDIISDDVIVSKSNPTIKLVLEVPAP